MKTPDSPGRERFAAVKDIGMWNTVSLKTTFIIPVCTQVFVGLRRRSGKIKFGTEGAFARLIFNANVSSLETAAQNSLLTF